MLKRPELDSYSLDGQNIYNDNFGSLPWSHCEECKVEPHPFDVFALVERITSLFHNEIFAKPPKKKYAIDNTDEQYIDDTWSMNFLNVDVINQQFLKLRVHYSNKNWRLSNNERFVQFCSHFVKKKLTFIGTDIGNCL